MWCCAALVVALLVPCGERTTHAHLATWGSWDITKRNLDRLFPESTKYLRKKYVYSSKEIENIEAFLGFALYPEDKTPEFYIAVKEESGRQKLLGVAIFIDPRSQPKIVGGEVVRLEVGVGVDTRGRIENVMLYDYTGNQALTAPDFLGQFRGRSLEQEFTLDVASGKESAKFPTLRAVRGDEEDCQLIANAAREALYLMKVALGQ